MRPARAPADDLRQNRQHGASLLAQAILYPSRHHGKNLATDDPALLQLTQLATQDARRDGAAEAAMEKRAADLAVARGAAIQDAENMQLVAAADELVEGDGGAELDVAHVQAGQARDFRAGPCRWWRNLCHRFLHATLFVRIYRSLARTLDGVERQTNEQDGDLVRGVER